MEGREWNNFVTPPPRGVDRIWEGGGGGGGSLLTPPLLFLGPRQLHAENSGSGFCNLIFYFLHYFCRETLKTMVY